MTEMQLLQERVSLLEAKLNSLSRSANYNFGMNVSFQEGKNMSFGTNTGTIIGTTTTQKLGFYGAPPVVRPNHVSTTAGVVLVLQTLGLIAP